MTRAYLERSAFVKICTFGKETWTLETAETGTG